MYQNIYYSRKDNICYIWDDVNGLHQIPFQNYAYRKRAGGRYKSIYGDELEKVTHFNPQDPSLFESDVPIETKILIDLYGESDEVSVGHRIGVIDIETDTDGGFPSVEEGDKEITAIAIYDYPSKKYIAYLLDKDGKGATISKPDVELHCFDNEYNLLDSFLNKWNELAFTIVSGWNCIPLNQSVWLKNKIIKIKDIQENSELFDSKLVQKFPISTKETWDIILENGKTISSSGDHRFPTKLVNPNEYITFIESNHSNILSADLKTKQIQSFSECIDVYCAIKMRKNENIDNVDFTDEQLYLAGLIYTDGTLKDPNCIKNGFTIHQSDVDFLNNVKLRGKIETSLVGPYKECFSIYVKYSLVKKGEILIYEKNKKRLNLEVLSTLSYKQFMFFLSGMLDGDGCKGNGVGYALCNFNDDLDTIHEICNWNGIFCTQSENNIRFIDIQSKDLVVLKTKRWGKQRDSSLTRTSKQKSSQVRFKKIGDVYWVKVKSVNNTKKQTRMMDIETDTHYFITNGTVSHNCNGFDFPYLYNRITNVMGKKFANKLSPIEICYINKWNKQLIIAGISCMDYMELFQKYADKKEPSYALGAIGKKFVKIEKIQYKGSLNDLYKEDINKYIEYNINDVQIVVALDKKFQYIDLARKICHVGHVGYENFSMSSRYLEGAILTYLRKNGHLIAPNKSIEGREEYEKQLENNEEGFDGAYVKDPIPGRYEWIYDLDLTSMYPNIIISLNISPETKTCKVDNWDVEKYLSGELQKIYISGNLYTNDEFKKLISEQNLSVASNGCLYKLPKNGKYGVIPSILIKWFDERKEMRKLAKKYADEKNWELYEFYDQRQKTQKIMLNSAYGTLGLQTFRFYDKDNASAVTLTGQDIIKATDKVVNLFYKNKLGKRFKLISKTGEILYSYEYNLPKNRDEYSIEEVEHPDYVIYVDTDSVFASAVPLIEKEMPNIDKSNEQQMTEAILKITSLVQKYVNDFYHVLAKTMFNLQTHRFDAKQEVIAKTGFWLVKKRYTQLVINKGGVVCDELEIKGIDVVRTSFPARFRSYMHDFLLDVLNKKDQSIIDSKILEFEKELYTIPIFEIAKNTSVKFISLDKGKNYDPKNRSPFTFILGTPAQVKAGLSYNDILKHLKLDKKYQKILNGQKIKWVYLMENDYGIDAIAMKADGTDPQQILDFIDGYVDRKRMYTQELKSKLNSFYEVLNLPYPNLAIKNASLLFAPL